MASSPYQQISPWMSYLEDTLLDQGEDGQQRLPDSGNAAFQPFFARYKPLDVIPRGHPPRPQQRRAAAARFWQCHLPAILHQISPWMLYLEDTLLDHNEDGQQLPGSGKFHPFFISFENGSPKGELGNLEKTNPRKRCSGTGGSKACREKMRRDRLNERFMELGAVLDPDKPIKSDKGAILADAVKVLSLLRFEARQLSASNAQLKEAIKELKAEKNELRDEKVRLKAEKEVLEQKMKAVTSSPGGGGGGYMPLSLAAFAPQTPKKAPMQGGGGLFEVPTMSDWLPSSTVDTSQDHILRPPVA